MARRKDLLSEAIADAKAVKETALANAKLALEEAFTPKLQSMISAKLAEEADEDEFEDDLESDELDVDMEEAEGDDEMDFDMDMDEEEEGEEDLDLDMDMGDDEMDFDMDMDEEEEGEDDLNLDMDMDEEEGEDEYMEEEDNFGDDFENGEDELDLESVIAELEGEMEDDEMEEDYMEEEDDMEDDMDDDEEFDLDEVIRTLKEMEDDEMDEAEDEDMGAELEEAYKTIESLKKTINEVNLLNAKLLYTNKLFRSFDLNENQKVKVLENFDRTSSVREVKLVFSTLAENLNVAKKKRSVVKEGYASKATKSSAPKKAIISEGNELSARWKKLAGLK